MRIAILNGESDASSTFQQYLGAIAAQLTAAGHTVTTLQLADLHLKGCSGCFGCWLKTPGECAKHDDSALICKTAIASDLVLLASPLAMGFTSALLKRAADQMIPLILPYFVIQGGEMHHRARYAHYPLFALLLGGAPLADAEDARIATTLWSRTARNMQSRLVYAAVAGTLPAALSPANLSHPSQEDLRPLEIRWNRTPQEVADELVAAA